MKQKADQHRNRIWISLCLCLLFLSFVAVLRSLFFGLDVDEQYALTMTYRLAQGDLLLGDMWEPHQTSGIFPALFVKLYLWIKGDSTYLLLFMRMVGIVLQGALAFYWYGTFRKEFGEKAAFLTALVLFHTVPKWIVMPEFANQQLWFWILTMLLLYRFAGCRRRRYCILAGGSFCLCVLAYPSAILLVFPYLWWLWRKDKKGAGWFLGTCVVIGGAFLGYLWCRLGAEGILTGIGHVLADPFHGEGASKLVRYGKELVEILIRLVIYGGIALAVLAVWSLITKKRPWSLKSILWGMLLLSMTDQVRLWMQGTVPHVHPQYHFLLLFVLGGVSLRKKNDLFVLGWISSFFGYAAVILLTNLDLKASLVHLLPGMLVTLLALYEDRRAKQVFCVLWILLLIGSHTFLIRGNWGAAENILQSKQKVLYGSAKGIYANYMTGTEMNRDYELLKDRIKTGTKAMYIGSGNFLPYVDFMTEVCVGSTISTPIFDTESLQYFTEHPEKRPEIIIIDKGYCSIPGNVSEEVLEWIERNYCPVEGRENEFIVVFFLQMG